MSTLPPGQAPPSDDDLRARPFVDAAAPAGVRVVPQSTPELGDLGVRPYLLTGGRTRSMQIVGGFETLVVETELGRERTATLSPEQLAILSLCIQAMSIAEVSARLRLPLGVAQVLAGDLVGAGLLAQFATPDRASGDAALLRRLIHAVEGI